VDHNYRSSAVHQFRPPHPQTIPFSLSPNLTNPPHPPSPTYKPPAKPLPSYSPAQTKPCAIIITHQAIPTPSHQPLTQTPPVSLNGPTRTAESFSAAKQPAAPSHHPSLFPPGTVSEAMTLVRSSGPHCLCQAVSHAQATALLRGARLRHKVPRPQWGGLECWRGRIIRRQGCILLIGGVML
jgi:hypothetical protein